MNKRISKYYPLIFLFLTVLIFNACNKDNEKINPTIQFKIGSTFVSKDTTLKIGDQFNFGIIADAGDVNLTNFIIKLSTGTEVSFVDTGMNVSHLDFTKLITKGISESEKWTFIIRDKEGKSASISLTILKDSTSTFGNIVNFPSVTLGAQSNPSIGSFFSLINGQVYTLDSAFAHQSLIEMLYCYDGIAGEANTIASANANINVSFFTGPEALANWTIKNETRYFKTTLTTNDFDIASNDSLLLVSYDELLGKRKAKNLVINDIYSFKTISGKYGLFKVKSVVGAESGNIEIAIKYQD